jgi:hypothetical protein
MTQSAIENELRALRSDVKEIVDRAQSREDEWRRLGLISMVSGILISLTGAGFLIANVVIARTNTNSGFHDQLVMMGITFLILNIPMMILGLALRKR